MDGESLYLLSVAMLICATVPVQCLYWIVNKLNALKSIGLRFFFPLSLSWILCFLFSTPPKTSALLISPCEGVVFIPKGGLSPLTDDEKCLQAECWKNSTFILCGYASCQFHYPCVHQGGHWRDELLILVLGGKAIFDRFKKKNKTALEKYLKCASVS